MAFDFHPLCSLVGKASRAATRSIIAGASALALVACTSSVAGTSPISVNGPPALQLEAH